MGAYYLLQLGWNYTRRDVKFTDLLILGHVVPICEIVENEIVYTISLKGQKTGSMQISVRIASLYQEFQMVKRFLIFAALVAVLL